MGKFSKQVKNEISSLKNITLAKVMVVVLRRGRKR